jgi:hypothetical protein
MTKSYDCLSFIMPPQNKYNKHLQHARENKKKRKYLLCIEEKDVNANEITLSTSGARQSIIVVLIVTTRGKGSRILYQKHLHLLIL